MDKAAEKARQGDVVSHRAESMHHGLELNVLAGACRHGSAHNPRRMWHG